MSDYREGCNYAKAVKAGIVDAKPIGGRSKRPTPITLYAYFRWLESSPKGRWDKRGHYRDEKTARAAADNLARKYRFYERFRIGEDGPEFDPRAIQGT